MFTYLKRTTSLANLGSNCQGQIATFLILMMVVVLIFILSTINIGQLSLKTTIVDNAADSTVLLLASQMATRSNTYLGALKKSCEKAEYNYDAGKRSCSIKTGVLDTVLAVVGAVIAVALAAFTGGTSLALWGALGGAIGGATGGALTYGNMSGALMGAIKGAAIGAAIGSTVSGMFAGAGQTTAAAGTAGSGGAEIAVNVADNVVTITEAGTHSVVTITEAGSLSVAPGTTVAAGTTVLSGSVFIPSLVAPTALNLGFGTYGMISNSVEAMKMPKPVFEYIARSNSGYPADVEMKETACFQALSQIVDDPQEINDEDDLDNDGNKTEKIGRFPAMWGKRTEKLKAKYAPVLRAMAGLRDLGMRYNTELLAGNDKLVGFLSRIEDCNYGDGELLGLIRPLAQRYKYSQNGEDETREKALKFWRCVGAERDWAKDTKDNCGCVLSGTNSADQIYSGYDSPRFEPCQPNCGSSSAVCGAYPKDSMQYCDCISRCGAQNDDGVDNALIYSRKFIEDSTTLYETEHKKLVKEYESLLRLYYPSKDNSNKDQNYYDIFKRINRDMNEWANHIQTIRDSFDECEYPEVKDKEVANCNQCNVCSDCYSYTCRYKNPDPTKSGYLTKAVMDCGSCPAGSTCGTHKCEYEEEVGFPITELVSDCRMCPKNGVCAAKIKGPYECISPEYLTTSPISVDACDKCPADWICNDKECTYKRTETRIKYLTNRSDCPIVGRGILQVTWTALPVHCNGPDCSSFKDSPIPCKISDSSKRRDQSYDYAHAGSLDTNTDDEFGPVVGKLRSYSDGSSPAYNGEILPALTPQYFKYLPGIIEYYAKEALDKGARAKETSTDVSEPGASLRDTWDLQGVEYQWADSACLNANDLCHSVKVTITPLKDIKPPEIIYREEKSNWGMVTEYINELINYKGDIWVDITRYDRDSASPNLLSRWLGSSIHRKSTASFSYDSVSLESTSN